MRVGVAKWPAIRTRVSSDDLLTEEILSLQFDPSGRNVSPQSPQLFRGDKVTAPHITTFVAGKPERQGYRFQRVLKCCTVSHNCVAKDWLTRVPTSPISVSGSLASPRSHIADPLFFFRS